MRNVDANKSIVSEYVRAFNAGNLDALKQIFHEDAEIQGVLGKGRMDEVAKVWQQLIEGYGIQLAIDEIISEGDVVAVRYTESGQFRAPAFGQEPTGKSYSLVAMEFFTIKDGKIFRRWGARDAMSQAKQLGLI